MMDCASPFATCLSEAATKATASGTRNDRLPVAAAQLEPYRAARHGRGVAQQLGTDADAHGSPRK